MVKTLITIVIDFFFTRCPTICPQMSSSMYDVQEKFDEIDEVKLLSVSIDSEYDRPDVLSRYSRKYPVNTECPRGPPSNTCWFFPPAVSTCRTLPRDISLK